MNKQDEEKAKSLWYHFCTEKSCDGYDDCKLCTKAQVHPQLIEMAAWKEQQMIEKAVSILRDEIQYHDIYEERDIETFRKRMMEEN